MSYDYRAAMRSDIETFLEDNYYINDLSDYDSKDQAAWNLYRLMIDDDDITGGGSNSYTYDREDAEAYLAGNLDLLVEALEHFGLGIEILKQGAEKCDVIIRQYLMPQVLSEILDEAEKDGVWDFD